MDNEKFIFENLANEYIESVSKIKKSSTIDQYKRKLRRNLLPNFAKRNILEIEYQEFLDWKKALDNKKVSFDYKEHYYSLFIDIYTYAKKKYEITNIAFEKLEPFHNNPNEIKKIPEQTQFHFWTLDQFLKYIECVDQAIFYTSGNKKYQKKFKQYLKLKIISYLCYYAGLRIGEATVLQVKDFKKADDHYYLEINKTLYTDEFFSEKKSAERFSITSPKTKSSYRNVPVPAVLSDYLLELIDKYYLTSDFYFVSLSKDLCSNNNLGKLKNLIEKKNNLEHIRFHDFRHSFATLLINSGESIETISKLLGHANASMTYNIYYHLLPEKAQKAVMKIDDLVKQQKEKSNE